MKPINVVADSKYSGMYRLQWANGDLSRWAYNRTRASDILRRYDDYRYAMLQSARLRGHKIGSILVLPDGPPMRLTEGAGVLGAGAEKPLQRQPARAQTSSTV
jgi:hypothetical protein